MEIIQGIDKAIVLYIAENFRSDVIDAIMAFITSLGNGGAVWFVCGFGLLFFKKHRRAGLMLIAALILTTCVNTLILKNLFVRPRPFAELPELAVIIKPPGGFSFPSGHAASSFTAAFMLAAMYGKRGAAAFILASLIAVSRVYAGVHYLSDIITGALSGTLCAWFTYRLFQRKKAVKPTNDRI